MRGRPAAAGAALILAIACGPSEAETSSTAGGADAGADVGLDDAGEGIQDPRFGSKPPDAAPDAAPTGPTFCTPLVASTKVCEDFEGGSWSPNWAAQWAGVVNFVVAGQSNKVLRSTFKVDVPSDNNTTATLERLVGPRPSSAKASFALAVRNLGATDDIQLVGFYLANPLSFTGRGHTGGVRVKNGVLELFDRSDLTVGVSLGPPPPAPTRLEITLDATDISARRLDNGAEGKLAFAAGVNDTNELRFAAGIFLTKKATAGAEVDIDDLWLDY
jgi:hypothetical protein